MARCPYLDFEDHGLYSQSKFICKVICRKMDTDDPKVKYVCKPDYGEEYRNCDIYKSK